MKPESPFSRAVVEDHLTRILASKGFAHSARMTRFLRFTVERALEGAADELKEYVLGIEVFDRKSSYDPRVDPIVRVEARRLRSKLKNYYANEGLTDPVVIEFPTGTYAPLFRERNETAPHDAPRPRSIAVLPFSNLSAEPDTEYFSDGLTEELIHGLTKLEGLMVVAWNSAARLKGEPHNWSEIGRQLNVSTVLVGSVRRSAERLRVMAQLVDTSSGRYLWSETYDRRMEDLFAIEEEISSAIVTTLRIRLMDRPGAPAIRHGTYNLEVYNLFLKGRFHWNKRTPEGLKRGLEFAGQCVALDPGFAPGYVGIADSYTLLAEYGILRPDLAIPSAKAAARKALEIDPTLAEAHASLGLIGSVYDWEWDQAGRHFERALVLNPGYASAHHWFSVDYLALLGRLDEALEEVEVAIELDPLSPIIREGKGYVLMLANRHDEAIEEYQRALNLDCNFYKGFTSMGRAYKQKGLYREAIAVLEKGRSLAGDLTSILGVLGQTYAAAGEPDRARLVLEYLDAQSRHRFVPSSCFAIIHIGLGEYDRAMDWLETGASGHETGLAALKVHPAYDPLRSRPRFEALLRTLGHAS